MTQKAAQLDTRWHVQVRPRRPQLDGHGRDILADVHAIGLDGIEGIASSKIYCLAGSLTESDVTLIASALLTDTVAEEFECRQGFSERPVGQPAIEVHALPGVMNPVAISALDAARRLLAVKGSTGAEIHGVQTARRYEVIGATSTDELDRIASSVLANGCIETWYIQGLGRTDAIPDDFPTPPDRPFALRHVSMRSLDDDALQRLSRDGHLFLSLEEMRTVRDHFTDLGREPTDLELETLAQTWSEHCVHKTLKSAIEYRGDNFGRAGQVTVTFDNLLKETIAAVTEKLDRDWCLSVFVDNAGVIAFDDDYGIAFKVETHNHPSAIEPYGGAATGIGGCIRDVMGCGLGAKPIASTDIFCFAPPDFDAKRLPEGVLHPRRILKGVVGGVRDYGNRMGIPTVNGAIFFDERYLGNPLVYCGCVGLIPRSMVHKQSHAGDRIVMAGGRTGRDGIHGATFSSAELTDTHADEFSHAVQIGNAIEEKKLLDAQLIARDHPDGCLYSAVTDCGAGGLSSAVGEMGEVLGATVDLDDVPLKYAGLRYDEIWISEAQERMVFAVPPENLDTFLAVFAAEEVEATVIGTFSDDRILRVRYRGHSVGELEMPFLHHGHPKTVRKASWTRKAGANEDADADRRSSATTLASTSGTASATVTGNERLLHALGEFNTASKEWVIRQYDHEVQGRSVVKPLVGPSAGPSDAAVLRPVHDRAGGIAIGCGMSPEWSDVDPYWMAVLGIDEALRNIICVGANPDRVAILDNFCWPKVDTEESMGALVRACRGAYDAALAYGLPFISGKDSLNNEFAMSEQEANRVGLRSRIAIPYTLLISAVGLIDYVDRCITMEFKTPGSMLVLASAPVDRAGLEASRTLHHKVSSLIRTGKVAAAHDVSDGGLVVAVAEMSIASGYGASVDWEDADDLDSMLESTATTYVLEMSEADALSTGWPIIGRVERDARLRVQMASGGTSDEAIDVTVADLERAWKLPLRQGGGR